VDPITCPGVTTTPLVPLLLPPLLLLLLLLIRGAPAKNRNTFLKSF
jgi:hypothetical protein